MADRSPTSRLVDMLAGRPPGPRSLGAQVQRARTYPPVHPKGWYQVARVADLDRGEVVPVRLLGEEVALFRTASGAIHALDGYCPHMGTHLASGGTVEGECLQCPFHGWTFDGQGAVRDVPYQDLTPRICARTWPVCVAYGLVFLWHGPVDDDGRPPYTPDFWPELDTDRFVLRGRYAPRDIGMHLSEFAENAVDVAHFPKLHGRMHIPWTRWHVPGMSVFHVADWKVDEQHPFLSHFLNDATLGFRGKELPQTGAHADATFVGPASVVMFRLTVRDLGDVMIAQTHTPLEAPGDPLRLRVRFTWWSERRMSRFFTHYIVGNWVSQWWQDVGIWENKVRLEKPKVVGGDGPVNKLRAWYGQFYEGVESP